MEPGALQSLHCSNCSAPLQVQDESAGLLRCSYCQHVHRFLPPPAAPEVHRHRPGDAVAVQWGTRWWPATVLDVVGPDAWRIHYDGWSSRWDEVVGPDRIRDRQVSVPAGPTSRAARFRRALLLVAIVAVVGLVLASRGGSTEPPGTPATTDTAFHVGERVQVLWRGSWYAATVVAVRDDGRVRIHYEAFSDSWDETVERDRVRVLGMPTPTGAALAPSASVRVGQRLEVRWRERWYPATVVASRPDGRIRVHYESYGSDWDEDVPRERVRVPP